MRRDRLRTGGTGFDGCGAGGGGAGRNASAGDRWRLAITAHRGMIAVMQSDTRPDISHDAAHLAEREAERRALVRASVISVGMILTFYMVNSLSIMTEFRWSGSERPAHFAWVQEGTAIFAMLVGLPLAMWLGHRFPIEPGRLRSSLAVHAGGLIVYSLIQITLMFVIRFAIWPGLFGNEYSVSGTWSDVYVYEFRKQMMAYIAFQMILSTDMTLERARLAARAARTEAQTQHRITLRCGGTVRLLEAAGFERARAAGNYVEARFSGRDHLARMTMAELERLLAAADLNVVRVHRSWLINRDLVTEIAPTGEGDVMLTLTTGEQVPGSRRYRERLQAA